MNERIKDLAEQAWKEILDETNIDGDISTMFSADEVVAFEQKFAELIVLEMCKELDQAQWDKGEDWICADGTRIIPQIKERFGVEE